VTCVVAKRAKTTKDKNNFIIEKKVQKNTQLSFWWKAKVQFTVFTRLNTVLFIKLLAFPMQRLFKGGIYSRAAFISKSYFLNH